MNNKKCKTCSEYKNCRDSHVSWIFFIIGLIATIALRLVTLLMSFNPIYGKIAWYTGVGGFFIFFVYKFRVLQAKAKLISRRNLVDKIRSQKQLTEEDYNLISSILCGISSRKEKVNFSFIFIFSAIALIVAVYFDFIK